jgi:3-mercaptopyruvate sulfurtransferase SseA
MIAGAVIVIALLVWALGRRAASAPAAPPTASAAAPAEHVHDPQLDTVRRIKPEELRDRIARGEVTVIDVRDGQSYVGGHIPGALHIPMARLDGEISYLPKNRPIVTYCT